MTDSSRTAESAGDAFVEAVARRTAELAAELVVARLREQPGFGSPIYATASNNPLGSRRTFLSAHRAGSFKTFRRGREVAALWKDVELWMLRDRKVQSVAGSGFGSLDEELAAACAPTKRRTTKPGKEKAA